MHELEELVDDSLEELSVSLEEPELLANEIHDVGSDDGLVVLASLHLAQAKEVLNNGHEEPLLSLFIWQRPYESQG